MQTLHDRIRQFIKLTDACIEVFEKPAAEPVEPDPSIKEALETIETASVELFGLPTAASINEERLQHAMNIVAARVPLEEDEEESEPYISNGAAYRCIADDAENIAADLAHIPGERETVRSILRFTRSLSEYTLDRELWKQVRANLEDTTEYLRISGGKQDGGKPEADIPQADAVDADSAEATLSAYLTDNRNANRDEALAAVNAAGFNCSRQWLEKNPVWKAHLDRLIREYVHAHPEVTGPKQIGDGLGYSKGTISAKEAYKELLPLLESRQAEQNRIRAEKKAAKKTTSARNLAWQTVFKAVRDYGTDDPDGVRAALRENQLYHRMEAYRVLIDGIDDAEIQKWIDRAKDGVAAGNANRGKNDVSEEEEAAWEQAHIRSARRREDNRRG